MSIERPEMHEELQPDMTVETAIIASVDHPKRKEDSTLDEPKTDANLPELLTNENFRASDLETVKKYRAIGEKARAKVSEDGFEAVFDGVSGRESNGSGAIAVEVTVGTVLHELAKLKKGADLKETLLCMEEAAVAANNEVQAAKGERDDLKDMASTFSMIRTMDGENGKKVVPFINGGDSRIYVLRGKTGKLEQITKDDSMADAMVHLGIITKEQYQQIMDAESPDELKDERLKKAWKARNAVREDFAIGATNSLRVNSGSFEVEDGDVIMLSSDGIHDNIPKSALEKMVSEGASADDIAKRAMKGTKPDDITLKMIRIGEFVPQIAEDEVATELGESDIEEITSADVLGNLIKKAVGGLDEAKILSQKERAIETEQKIREIRESLSNMPSMESSIIPKVEAGNLAALEDDEKPTSRRSTGISGVWSRLTGKKDDKAA